MISSAYLVASMHRSGRYRLERRFAGRIRTCVVQPGATGSNIDESRRPEMLGAEQLRAMSRLLRCHGRPGIAPDLEDRWIDVSYYDLVEDPMEVVARI